MSSACDFPGLRLKRCLTALLEPLPWGVWKTASQGSARRGSWEEAGGQLAARL